MGLNIFFCQFLDNEAHGTLLVVFERESFFERFVGKRIEFGGRRNLVDEFH